MSTTALEVRGDGFADTHLPVQLQTQRLDVYQLGETLARSGFFSDVREASQAVVKMLAGAELGFGPIASMNGIYIVKGRVTMGANLIAAAIKRSGKYDFRVAEITDKRCSISFRERAGGGWEAIGESTFTEEDARRAGTQNMGKFPRNMLYARALTNGARWFTPDVFGGPVYTPDELGATVDEEGVPTSSVVAPPSIDRGAATDALYRPLDPTEPDPAAAPAAQMDASDTQKLMALWSQIGLAHKDHRDARLAFASYVLGIDVESFTNLHKADAQRLERLARAILNFQEQRAPELSEPSALRTFCLWAMEQGAALTSPSNVAAALDAFQYKLQKADGEVAA